MTTYSDQPDKLHSKVSVMWEKYPIPRRVIIMFTYTSLMFVIDICKTEDLQSCQQTYGEYIKSKLTKKIQSGNSNEEKENWSKYISIDKVLWFVFFTY